MRVYALCYLRRPVSARRIWIVLALAVALPVAGCGGGGDETTEAGQAVATTTALAKDELIERGDSICAEVNAAVGTVATSAEESGQAAQIAGLYNGMVASLNGIGTPQEADGYADFSAAAEALASAQDEVELAAERGDPAALEAAQSGASAALADFRSAAAEYGFEECGEEASAPAVAGSPESGEGESEAAEAPEALEPEAEGEPEAAPQPAPETGGAGGAGEGGGTGGGTGGGEGGGGSSGGIGPG